MKKLLSFITFVLYSTLQNGMLYDNLNVTFLVVQNLWKRILNFVGLLHAWQVRNWYKKDREILALAFQSDNDMHCNRLSFLISLVHSLHWPVLKDYKFCRTSFICTSYLQYYHKQLVSEYDTNDTHIDSFVILWSKLYAV